MMYPLKKRMRIGVLALTLTHLAGCAPAGPIGGDGEDLQVRETSILFYHLAVFALAVIQSDSDRKGFWRVLPGKTAAEKIAAHQMLMVLAAKSDWNEDQEKKARRRLELSYRIGRHPVSRLGHGDYRLQAVKEVATAFGASEAEVNRLRELIEVYAPTPEGAMSKEDYLKFVGALAALRKVTSTGAAAEAQSGEVASAAADLLLVVSGRSGARGGQGALAAIAYQAVYTALDALPANTDIKPGLQDTLVMLRKYCGRRLADAIEAGAPYPESPQRDNPDYIVKSPPAVESPQEAKELRWNWRTWRREPVEPEPQADGAGAGDRYTIRTTNCPDMTVRDIAEQLLVRALITVDRTIDIAERTTTEKGPTATLTVRVSDIKSPETVAKEINNKSAFMVITAYLADGLGEPYFKFRIDGRGRDTTIPYLGEGHPDCKVLFPHGYESTILDYWKLIGKITGNDYVFRELERLRYKYQPQ